MAKVKLFDEQHGTYKFKCPAGHWHYINTKVPNQQNAQWEFNGNLERPTFTPSINETCGRFVIDFKEQDTTPEYKKFLDENSYRCHFIITDGKIHFCSDCSHSLAGQTVDLPEVE